MTLDEQIEALAQSQGGELTDEQMMAALGGSLSEGDITAATTFAAANPGEPNAGAVTTPPAQEIQEPAGPETKPTPTPPADNAAPQPSTTEVQPVIMAKDGVHTIDYNKLVEAREAERAAKAEAESLRAQLAAARTTAPAPSPDAAPAAQPAVDASKEPVSFGTYDDKDLATGVQVLIDRALTQAKAEWDKTLTPLQVQAVERAHKEHLTTIYSAHPDAESIVVSREFEAWKASQPSFTRNAIEAVQDRGTAAQMVELLNSYRAARPATPSPAPAPAPAPGKQTVAQRAEEAIAAAKDRTPNSLSDLPAGTQVHHDETAAYEQMDGLDLANLFLGKTPAQREDLMRKML